MRLVELVAGDALHELVVGNRVAVAEHHGGDLTVENRVGNLLGQVPDDFNVLPRGVEYLDDLLVGQKVEKRREVDPRRQRVDHESLVRRGDLGHAE